MALPVSTNPEAGFRYRLRRALPGILLVGACGCLLIIGLLVLYSAGLGESGAARKAASSGGKIPAAQAFIIKQAIYACFGIAAMIFAWRMNIEWPRKVIVPIAVVSILLLASVLVPGVARMINGSKRWLELGVVNVQVSDFAKIGFIFVMAHYLAKEQRQLDRFWKGYVVPLCIVGVPFLMIIVQPDYGTALLVGIVGGTMIFMAGARLRYIVPTVLIGIAAFSAAVFSDPVRKERIVSFLNMKDHKSGGAYQLWQGILAFGSGGLNGVGLGNGRQQNSLPEIHTDFIFAIIGEEMGFIWTCAVVILFLTILIVCVCRLHRAPNLYQYMVVSGALLLLTLQALINFGVVTGCLPTKGMSLPLISYGGSNLVATCFLIGILLNGLTKWGYVSEITPNEVLRT
jgi:cell division protein FtsW